MQDSDYACLYEFLELVVIDTDIKVGSDIKRRALH